MSAGAGEGVWPGCVDQKYVGVGLARTHHACRMCTYVVVASFDYDIAL